MNARQEIQPITTMCAEIVLVTISNINADVLWGPEKVLWRQAGLWYVLDGYTRTYAIGFTLPQISMVKQAIGLDFSVCRLKGGFLFYLDILRLLKNGDTELSLWKYELN